jgi:hypothetical protein
MLEVIMNATRQAARVFAVLAGVSLLGLAGPAALADDEPGVNPSPTVSAPSDEGAIPGSCVVVDRPERTLRNGKVIPARTHVSDECLQLQQELRTQARDQATELREERAQLREEIRINGGSWGAYVRQETLLRVAAHLAERHEQAPTAASLGRILTLINSGLPEALQVDINAFLAQYALVFADLIPTVDDSEDVTS